MLDKSIPNDDTFIHGFSRNIFRSDHPGGSKIGGVCLYYRENLPITQTLDLQVLDEMIVSEVKIGCKKSIYWAREIYWSRARCTDLECNVYCVQQ